jgi:HEAT repeat protein
MPTGATDESVEVDRQIQALLAPSGDPQYRRERAEALEWLLAHAARAYPKLRAIVDAPVPPVLAVLALARFQRADSLPSLERVLREGDDATVVVAAQALAELRVPEALTTLERALQDGRDQVVASAADALADRGDRLACPSLSAARAHPNAEVRARLLAARKHLRCPPRS